MLLLILIGILLIVIIGIYMYYNQIYIVPNFIKTYDNIDNNNKLSIPFTHSI